MFRSLFRSNRTIRVPIDDSGHDVRRVKIFKRAMSKPSSLMTGFFVAYFVVRIIEASLFTPDGTESGSKSVAGENGKTDKGQSNPQTEMSNHWKKAHRDLQEKENIRTSKPSDVHIRLSNTVQAPNTKKSGNQLDQLQQNMLAAINIPVWIRERERRLYNSSDPEYKDYVRLQSDEQKLASLKKQVIDWGVSRLKVTPKHLNSLAHIGFQGKVVVMLELIPQIHAPALYEVPCLIIFRDGIGWGWRVLPPQIGNKMDSLMRPSIAFGAAKAAFSAFFSTSYTIAKARFNGQSSKTATSGTAATSAPNAVMSDKEIANDNDRPPLSRWTSTPQSIQELLRAVHSGQSFQERHNSMIKNMPFYKAIEVAAETYKRKQMLSTALDLQRRTRGVIHIRATLYCIGDRGKMRLDVKACYLPSEDRFLGPMTLTSAYLIKDYSLVDQIEQGKKKKKASTTQQDQKTTASKPVASTTTRPKPESEPDPSGKKEE